MSRLLFLVGLIVLGTCAAEDDELVVAVDGGSFDKFIEDNPITMVEFYAPWCGHCKKLLPEFEGAAKELAEDGVQLGKVDCTADESKELCEKFGVRGYPTIKFFNNGQDAAYELGRTNEDITRYIKSRSGPSVTVLEDAEEAKKFSTSSDIVVIAFAEDLHKEYDATASQLRDEVTFGLVKDSSVAEGLDAAIGDVVLFRKFDEPRIKFEGEVSQSELSTFITAESFPLVGEIGPTNYKKYMDRGLPLVWVAVDPSDEDSVKLAKEHAPAYKGKLSLVTIDGKQFASHIKNLGHEGDLPGVIITEGQKKFLHREDELTSDSLGAFLKGWEEGSLEQFLKSQEVPETNDASVFVLVGKNFDDEVVNNEKDVLVEFYAPWCGHCKKLEPEYDALGDLYNDNENVVIAKMDSTENDGPIEIRGFPTLVFFPSADKANPVTYSGARTTDGLDDFLKKNAIHAKAEAAGGEKEHDHDEL